MNLASRILKPILISSILLALLGGIVGLFYNLSLYFQIVERRGEAEIESAKMSIVRHYLYGDIIGLRSHLEDIARANRWRTAEFTDAAGELVWRSKALLPSEASTLWLRKVFRVDRVEKSVAIDNGAGVLLGRLNIGFNIPLDAEQITKLLVSFFVPFSLFFLIYLITTYVVLRKATGPLDELTIELKRYATELNLELNNQGTGDQIEEVRRLFIELRDRWKEALNLALKNEAEAAQARVATQVAHDIRSPLTALNILQSSIGSLSEDRRLLLRSAIGRITEIANNLLSSSRPSHAPTAELVTPLVRSLIDEKRIEITHKSTSILNFEVPADLPFMSVLCDPVELKRMISNLVNNAVEAANKKDSSIEISVNRRESFCEITIQDHGCGIQPEILSRIGQRGFTSGKNDGSGLGIWHAIQCCERWNGSLRITSELEIGTKVVICLPIAEKQPTWLASQISLNLECPVVIVDDDASIHNIWRIRFGELEAIPKLHNFFAIADAEQKIETLKSSKSLFLVDQQLANSSLSGLEFIEKHNIAASSVLVTTAFEVEEVRIKARGLGVKILPKSLTPFISITPVM